jgi:glucose/arabinose dehydrogenase
MRRLRSGFLAALAVLATTEALAVELQPFLQGLSSPVYITHSGDGTGRLFVVEQVGRIRVRQPSGVTTVFLDITDRVECCGERGLLGLAFHPDYPTTPFFYVHYTRGGGDIVISRFQVSANPNLATPGSELVLRIIEHSAEGNHNGGMVAFGPDGKLYVGIGDGGGGNDPNNNAQNTSPNNLLGKVLRFDVDIPAPYIPGDNPFGSNNLIWAYGLRNPFRFSFDRATGQLFLGDVGQNQREEIDIITAGGNYGWRVFEGTRCTDLGPALCGPQFIPPIAEYGHSVGRCSVTGGYVYRGTAGTLPVGTYVFADFCTGEIFVLQNGAVQLLLDTSLNIASFGEDEAGELYVVGLGGTVHRLVAGSGAFAGGVFVAAGDLAGAGTILTGPGPSGHPHVRIFRPNGIPEATSLFPYPVPFRGGVTVAVGDVDHDGVADLVVGAGPGGGPHVQVFSGADPAVVLASFFAFAPAFTGGVFVAAGDVNGDLFADLIVGAGAGGGPHVRVFSGANLTELHSFFAFAPGFTGGVRVAAGDVNGDGRADIVVGPGPGGAPHVRVFSGTDLAELRSFFAFSPAFAGGVFVAAGNLTPGAIADLVVGAGAGGGPHVRAFDGTSLAELASFFAYAPAFTGGVRVAVGDATGEGQPDILTGPGPGGGPHIRAFTGGGLPLAPSFFAY